MPNLRQSPKPVKIRLTERELNVLLYLWKWKLVSQAALTAKFFGKVSPGRAYNKLRELYRAGFVAMTGDDEGQRFAWTLAPKGFAVVLKYLPVLRESGFRSEHFTHDFLTTAFHLGDWLVGAPKSVKFFSEQDLRRLSPDEIPVWVPAPDAHRPDGYWGFDNGGTWLPVAVEVEIHRKSPAAYAAVAEYYADFACIHRVFWLVPSLRSALGIQSKLSRPHLIVAAKHNFVTVPDFLHHQWDAPIIIGADKGKTVRSLLFDLARETGGKMTGKFSAGHLLESRKSFVRT